MVGPPKNWESLKGILGSGWFGILGSGWLKHVGDRRSGANTAE